VAFTKEHHHPFRETGNSFDERYPVGLEESQYCCWQGIRCRNIRRITLALADGAVDHVQSQLRILGDAKFPILHASCTSHHVPPSIVEVDK
jgi:hypothetical protein